MDFSFSLRTFNIAVAGLLSCVALVDLSAQSPAPAVPVAPAPASASPATPSAASDVPKAAVREKAKPEAKESEAEKKEDSAKKKEPAPPSEPGLKTLDEIPSSFPKVSDAFNYEWSVQKNGSVDGSNSSMDDAMTLLIGDEVFDPERAEISEKDESDKEEEDGGNGQRIVLTNKLENGIKVTRHILINTDQGGMRYLDVFENTTDDEMTAKIGYTAKFPNQPGGIYSNTGKISNGELGAKDAGLALQAQDESGYPSVVMLFADEKSKVKPKVLIAKGNEVQVAYSLPLKKGEKKALLQWVGQRELTDSRSVRDAFDKIYRRRKLEDAQIPGELSKVVVNFDVNLADGVHAPYADDLLAVVQLCERLDVERDSEDVLWVGSGSRLSGVATVSAESFTMESRFGAVEVTLADVAALQGGGGLGREHRVYLRDGTVLNGKAAIEGLAIKGNEGWNVALEMEQMEYLIFKLAPNDGKLAEDDVVFMELHTGDVVSAVEVTALPLSFISPWGKLDVTAGNIKSMREVKVPTPRYRIVLKDGSELTVFMVAQPVEFKSGSRGALSIVTNEVARLWRAGDRLPGEIEDEDYEEMEELPPGSSDACLLQGSNILAGVIANEKLNLVSGATVTSLSPAEIASIVRSDDDFSELIPGFEVELRGGSQMNGYFQEKTIQVKTSERLWSIPVQHFLAARKNVKEKN